MIAENLKKVRENIIRACKRSGRDPGEVMLLAVSKKKQKRMTPVRGFLPKTMSRS